MKRESSDNKLRDICALIWLRFIYRGKKVMTTYNG